MDLKNATEFDRVVTHLLTVLAESFPKPIDLDFQVIGLADGPAHETKNYNSVDTEHTPKHEFAAQCVSFLMSEGYVSGTPHPTWARYVLLTAKGLELINAVPDSLLRGTHS
ncbi:hypothetical protein PUN49_01175 [Pseudomonas extremaustralis]|uniref:hypothetical protein n=1 Tax=Pseudomonas TaxID=286 RepID=UPI00165601EC|nr:MULTISPECIES: hypothetical protein [Pseudomonas]MBC8787625.1 hypothetical protein [Pseudomonas fluorescens]MDG2965641.1 hypothetical protein [Pseudomonas extremaustralis]MDG2965653.1 hypothetical protein [Pseudomonas extremaustralis]